MAENPETHHPPLLPSNYITIVDLQKRWLKQQQQQQQHQKEKEDKEKEVIRREKAVSNHKNGRKNDGVKREWRFRKLDRGSNYENPNFKIRKPIFGNIDNNSKEESINVVAAKLEFEGGNEVKKDDDDLKVKDEETKAKKKKKNWKKYKEKKNKNEENRENQADDGDNQTAEMESKLKGVAIEEGPTRKFENKRFCEKYWEVRREKDNRRAVIYKRVEHSRELNAEVKCEVVEVRRNREENLEMKCKVSDARRNRIAGGGWRNGRAMGVMEVSRRGGYMGRKKKVEVWVKKCEVES